MLCFYSAKGGAGCSVTAAAVSLLLSKRQPTLLVDLAGDLPEILGLGPDHAVDGLGSWVAADEPAPDSLRWLEQPIAAQLTLLGSGGGAVTMSDERLVSSLRSCGLISGVSWSTSATTPICTPWSPRPADRCSSPGRVMSL